VTDWPLTCPTSGLEKVELLGELFDNLWVRAVHPGDIATLEHPLRSEGRDNPGHGPAQITKDRDGCLTRQRGGLYWDVVEVVEPGKFATPSPVCRVPPPAARTSPPCHRKARTRCQARGAQPHTVPTGVSPGSISCYRRGGSAAQSPSSGLAGPGTGQPPRRCRSRRNRSTSSHQLGHAADHHSLKRPASAPSDVAQDDRHRARRGAPR
jgi:hypothetical protein